MTIDMQLPKIDEECGLLPINGRHGLCRAYYEPDVFDIRAIEYAQHLSQQSTADLRALDLGCSPYFPHSQRFAKLGFAVDAFDLEPPMANFSEINQQYNNRIRYQIKNLCELKTADISNHYDIVYSNRCLSFLNYPDTRQLIHNLISHIKNPTRYFLAFFNVLGKYADNYPKHLPLEKRYVSLDNDYARHDKMLAPVCLYTEDELLNVLLADLPINIIEILQAKSGSLKIIFDKI